MPRPWKKRRRRQRTETEKDRLESDPRRPETKWMDAQKQLGGPSNPTAIPGGLSGASEFPEATIAWVIRNCKFARSL
jgi:hypothetical protein